MANLATNMRLKTPARRDAVWSDEDCARFFAQAGAMGWPDWKVAPLRLFFALLRYTAQRPGDVAGMTWGQHDGATIKLRQAKTGKLLEVPCHAALQAVPDDQDRNAIHMIALPDGRPVPLNTLRNCEAQVRAAAELRALQLRDLRRTAMVRMAEAGADAHQVAAVSGHAIDRTTQILETYLPRTAEMANAAVLRWVSKKAQR